MADMRRRSPEPPPEHPQVQLTPGLGEQTMRELAPLLAKEDRRRQHRRAGPGHPASGTEPSRRTAQLDPLHPRRQGPRPGRRRPCGWSSRPSPTATPPRPAVPQLQVQPDSPGNAAATRATCIGVALQAASTTGCPALTPTPRTISAGARAPARRALAGEGAATDILVLGRKGRSLQLARHPDRQGEAASMSSTEAPSPSAEPAQTSAAAPHRHAGPRHSPRSSALKRLLSTSISHRVATVTGICDTPAARLAAALSEGRPHPAAK